METKKKHCNGIGKAYGFQGCGNEFYKRTFGLCDSCLYDWYTNTEMGKITFAKAKQSLQSKKKTEQRKADAVQRKKLDGIAGLKKDFEKEMNSIARLIDKGSGCISCNGDTTPQAGHYHSVQSNGSIRYNLHNLHLQDYNCNCAKGANTHKYDLGLIERYGKDYWEYVKFDIVALTPILKMTTYQYEEKIAVARQIVKGLQSNEILFSPQQRMMLRDKFNTKIGLYPTYFCTK